MILGIPSLPSSPPLSYDVHPDMSGYLIHRHPLSPSLRWRHSPRRSSHSQSVLESREFFFRDHNQREWTFPKDEDLEDNLLNYIGDNDYYYYVDYDNLASLSPAYDPEDNQQYGDLKDVYDDDLYKFFPVPSPDMSLPLHETYYKTDFLSGSSEGPVLPPVQEVFYLDSDQPPTDFSQSQRHKKSLFAPPVNVNQNTPLSGLGHSRNFRKIFSPSLQIQDSEWRPVLYF